MEILNTKKTLNTRLKHFQSDFLGHFKNSSMQTHLISFPVLSFPYYTSNLNNFEHHIYGEKRKFSYHLSGYGSTYNESILALMGESVERYAFVSQIKYHKYKYGSYIEMCKNTEIDFSYINIHNNNDAKINEKDEISWVEMINIHTLKKSYVPTQLVLPASYPTIDNKKYILDTVSTGTAAHETFLKALECATYELLQLDSFNMWWYLGYEEKKININIKSLLDKRKIIDTSGEFYKNFHIIINDISFDKTIYVIAIEIISKKDYLPKYTVGISSGLDLENVIYRATMEALTVLEYSFNIPWFDSKQYMEVNKKSEFFDLDKNVIYYSKNGKPQLDKRKFNNWNKVKFKTLYDVINTLPKETFFLDITPIEFQGLNQKVVRVVSPSLLPMCLPAFPPKNHPRYNGGIFNSIIHPLA